MSNNVFWSNLNICPQLKASQGDSASQYLEGFRQNRSNYLEGRDSQRIGFAFSDEFQAIFKSPKRIVLFGALFEVSLKPSQKRSSKTSSISQSGSIDCGTIQHSIALYGRDTRIHLYSNSTPKVLKSSKQEFSKEIYYKRRILIKCPMIVSSRETSIQQRIKRSQIQLLLICMIRLVFMFSQSSRFG